MPKILNVEKLKRKFASLTRSKESIQGVSSWIMHHSEFNQEIVDQWLIGLSTDNSALVMFYVANDVIQNCGKKRVPEFREAFSTVLEKAVSLEKVKEIKSEVCRLLTIWKDRDIYDDEFTQRLQNQLNSTEVEEVSSEDEVVSELEIISHYKKQRLIDKLRELKSLESEIKEQEDILNYADVPEMPELDDLIVRRECQGMLRKCDTFYNLVADCLKLANDEIKLRKEVLKELNDSCIFYAAQNRDVKEVANAFRVYGKRVKVVEKQISEKKLTFPSPVISNSPCFSEDNISISPCRAISPYYMNDTSSVSKGTPSEQSQSSLYFNDCMKQGNSFLGRIPTETVSGPSEHVEEISHENLTKESTNSFLTEVAKLDFDELKKIIESSAQTQLICNQSTNSTSSESKSSLIQQNEVISHNQTSISDKEANDFPDKKINSLNHDVEIIFEHVSPTHKISPSVQQTESMSDQHIEKTAGQAKESVEQTKNTAEHTESTSIQKSSDSQAVSEDNDVDFLLEVAYDSRKPKSSVSYKRKIECLLNFKGKKPCKDPPSEEIPADASVNKLGSEVNSILETESRTENVIDIVDETDSNFGQMKINQKESDCEADCTSVVVPEKFPDNVEPLCNHIETGINPIVSLEQKTDETSNLIEPLSSNLNTSNKNQPIDVNDTFTGSVSCSNNLGQSEEGTMSINLNATFTGSALSSFMSGMSTELLKNILQKNNQNVAKDSQDNIDIIIDDDHSNSSNKNPPLDFLLQDLKQSEDDVETIEVPKEENDSLIPSKDIYLGKDIILYDSKSNSESTESPANIKKDIQTSPDEKIVEFTSAFSLDRASKTVCSDEPIPFLRVEQDGQTTCIDNHKEIISSVETSNLNNNVQLVNDNKPSVLQTLQSVLECLSENMLSGRDLKSIPLVDTALAPPMPLESCLKVYNFLRCDDTNFLTNSNCLISQSNTNTSKVSTVCDVVKTYSSNVCIQDNFEVMDMECDSDG